MVAINFKPAFAGAVATGTKRQTIRPTQRCEIGDRLQLFTGMRTKRCRKLGEGICTGVAAIRLEPHHALPVRVQLAGEWLPQSLIASIAKQDGFASVTYFAAFFETLHGLPFDGFLHQWRLIGGEA